MWLQALCESAESVMRFLVIMSVIAIMIAACSEVQDDGAERVVEDISSHEILPVSVETVKPLSSFAEARVFGQGMDTSPVWSPDGTRIAYMSDRGGDFNIYIMDIDGDKDRQLTVDPNADVSPVWSPDSSKIAFVSARVGYENIYVMDADGGNLQQLTDDPVWALNPPRSPAWSPDGTRIIFISSLGLSLIHI